MLQTIYESDSCFSSDGVAGREQLLAQQRMHSMLSSGKSLSVAETLHPGKGGWLGGAQRRKNTSPCRFLVLLLLLSWCDTGVYLRSLPFIAVSVPVQPAEGRLLLNEIASF